MHTYIYTGWWFGTWLLFSHILIIIIPTDELHHFSEGWLNYQPVYTHKWESSVNLTGFRCGDRMENVQETPILFMLILPYCFLICVRTFSYYEHCFTTVTIFFQYLHTMLIISLYIYTHIYHIPIWWGITPIIIPSFQFSDYNITPSYTIIVSIWHP